MHLIDSFPYIEGIQALFYMKFQNANAMVMKFTCWQKSARIGIIKSASFPASALPHLQLLPPSALFEQPQGFHGVRPAAPMATLAHARLS